MNRENVSIVVLSDLHFGPNKNNEVIYKALTEVVYPHILETKPDIIVIAGDDTDERISFDQAAARYHLRFCNDIVQFKTQCKRPIAIRFISGTESHQKNQLQAYQYLTANPSVDVKIFTTVSEECLCGCNILFIPEESVDSKHTFYKNTVFSGIGYDLVFGHGMFDFISRGWGDVTERSLKGSPLWSCEDFSSVKGVVVFGHVHTHTAYKERIYYGGSLTRFCHGEEEPKGFLNVYYKPTTKQTEVRFIENPFAPKYITKHLSKTLLDMKVDELMQALIQLRESNAIQELRTLLSVQDIDVAKLQVIRTYFANHPEHHIRIEVQKEANRHKEANPTQNALSAHFSHITNPDDWEINTIAYAEKAFNTKITKEQIGSIMSKCKQYETGGAQCTP